MGNAVLNVEKVPQTVFSIFVLFSVTLILFVVFLAPPPVPPVCVRAVPSSQCSVVLKLAYSIAACCAMLTMKLALHSSMLCYANQNLRLNRPLPENWKTAATSSSSSSPPNSSSSSSWRFRRDLKNNKTCCDDATTRLGLSGTRNAEEPRGRDLGRFLLSDSF